MGPVIRRAHFLCLLLAAPALAGLGPEAAPIRLVEPADGAVWTVGESAALAWEPEPGFERQAKLEEWEVFLSVDGGLTFPVRLTPHLDISRRRVVVDVPDLPTERGRLLLRVGDEREERSVDVPIVLRIVAGAPARSFNRRAPSLAPGEAARTDGRPVLFWTEGARDGSGWREREAALPPRAALTPGASAGAPLLLVAASTSDRCGLAPPPPAVRRAAAAATAASARPGAPNLDRPILLLSSRRNQ